LRKAAYLALIVPLVILLFSVSAKASSSATYPSIDAAGTQMELDVEVLLESDIMNSGQSIPITVQVRDQNDVPVENAVVTIGTNPGEDYCVMAETDVNGRMRSEFSAASSEEVELTLTITVARDGSDSVETEFVVTVFPVQENPISGEVPILIGALMATTFMSTEVGKYGLFKIAMFPLYTRLKKDEVLDHFVRGQIYGFIMSHPGENYNCIKSKLDITNGTLSHHLRTLEVQGFIKSRRDGVHTRFYPIDMKVPQGEGTKLSDLQIQIMEQIKKGESLTQAEIAVNLNVSQQCISYNLRHMKREGIIGIERFGRERKYYLMDT
jgi:DNA-binding MarR family transcriptional regulator